MRPRLATLLVWSATVAVSCGGDGTASAPSDASTTDTSVVDVGASDSIEAATTEAGTDAISDAITDTIVDAAATTETGDVDAGTLLFNGDFEPGDLSQWPGVEGCAKDRITVYDSATAPTGAPKPYQGNYAAHYHVLDTDVAPCTSTDNPRAQLSTALTLLKPGDDVWERWAIYVPSTFPAMVCPSGVTCKNGVWLLFQEDYGPPWDGAPSIGWDILNLGGVDSFAIARGQYGSDNPWHMPLIKSRWIEFLVHKKLANTATGGGSVEAFVDGSAVTFKTSDPASCVSGCTQLAMQTMHPTMSGVAFFMNTYRAVGFAPLVDLYFDVGRIGTTRASVEGP
ncbi:MAG: hypothetical protein ACHREM_05775 [Polyangiales bacterium]